VPRLPFLAILLAGGVAVAACTSIPPDELQEAYGEPNLDILGLDPAPSTTSAPFEPNENARSADGREPRVQPLAVDDGACPFDRAGYAVDCGSITIDDGGDADPVTLTFARFRAGNPTADPVVYLHGGPGGGVLAVADLIATSVVDPFIADRDVILYDQRGAGESSPLPLCRETWALDDRFFASDDPHDEIEAAYVEALERCADRIEQRTNLDLADYSSAVHADDLLDLIRALGFESVNLYGNSYGTRLAHTMMRDHPEPIRSVILAGVYPPEVNLIGSVPASFHAALDHLFSACSADPVCGGQLPDPWATLDTIFARLDRTPIRVAVAGGDTTSFTTHIAGDDLVNIIHGLLYTVDGAALVPDLIIDLEAGDTGRLDRVAQDGIFDTADVLPWLGVLCREEAPFATDAERAEAERTDTFAHRVSLAPGLIGAVMYDACPLFPSIGVAEPLENDPVVWSQPTLLLSGALDPITPPWWADAVAARLPNATLAHFADRGHDADEGPCAVRLMADFVADPAASLDVSCAAEFDRPFLTNAPVTLVSPFDADLLASSFDVDPGPDTQPVDVLLPDWYADHYLTESAYWRGLDGWDPTVVVVRSGAWAPEEVFWYIDPATTRSFEPTPTPATIDRRWERLSFDTAVLDAVSYVIEEDGFELNVSVVGMSGEIDSLETSILRPIVQSISLP